MPGILSKGYCNGGSEVRLEKRILIIREYGGYGGIEHQIETIVSGLIKAGWKVLLLTDKESPLAHGVRETKAEVIVSPFNGYIKTARLICSICREYDIRIVQSHMLRESFYCRFAKLIMPSLKHVFRVHTYIDCSHITDRKKKLYHLAGFVTGILVNRYVSINEYNVFEMRSRTHIPQRKITVIHNAVRSLTPCETACPYKNGNIAMIANFVDFKGHDVLLDGLKILKDRGYKFTAHMIGSVPGYGTDNEDNHRLKIVQQTIADYGLENWTSIDGYCADIADAIKTCGMIVLPSDSEGTPNVLLEGMLLGKIVVASAVGGVPEFVVEGKTGFLHKPKDSAAFADALLRAYSKPEESLTKIAENALNVVRKEYSAESLIKQLLGVYSNLF